MTPRLTDDQIWAAIDAQRLRVCDLLDLLTDEEWRHSSLCDGWTVRDVAAHLTLQQATWGQALPKIVKYRGNTERMIREWARDRAAQLSTDQLVAEIRATVGTHRTTAVTTHRESLIDALVHGQDIALPLGRSLEVPTDAAAEAATRMWTMRFPAPFPATRAMKRFRVVATDIDWSAGAGAEVCGPIAAVMLVLSGRLVALPQLSGPGAEVLASQLRGPAAR
jgi:uncharacterized protein (TIGR03083 family)